MRKIYGRINYTQAGYKPEEPTEPCNLVNIALHTLSYMLQCLEFAKWLHNISNA